MKKEVAIVIPIYKEELSFTEKKSFEQCITILGGHPIIIFCPVNFTLPREIQALNLQVISFPDHYFDSISAYNKLMLSQVFYEAFTDYKFVLIYQLDAYVFTDQLLKWCSREYDYIGAPWIIQKQEGEELKTGNGGFSLRNVHTSLGVLKANVRMISRKEIFNKNSDQSLLKTIKDNFQKKSFSNYFIDNFPENEDYFWSHFAPQIDPDFIVPTGEKAIAFAFEKRPKLLYELNGYNLPFGCHAWEKYDPIFWKEFIQY